MSAQVIHMPSRTVPVEGQDVLVLYGNLGTKHDALTKWVPGIFQGVKGSRWQVRVSWPGRDLASVPVCPSTVVTLAAAA
jgi:hypothetical protein